MTTRSEPAAADPTMAATATHSTATHTAAVAAATAACTGSATATGSSATATATAAAMASRCAERRHAKGECRDHCACCYMFHRKPFLIRCSTTARRAPQFQGGPLRRVRHLGAERTRDR
jgi:hypothetical protein